MDYLQNTAGNERVIESNISYIEDSSKNVNLSDLECRIWKCVDRVELIQGHRLDYQVKPEFLSGKNVEDLMRAKNSEIYPAVEPTLSDLEERSLFPNDEALGDYVAASLLKRWIYSTTDKVCEGSIRRKPEEQVKVLHEEIKELAENCPEDTLDSDLRDHWNNLKKKNFRSLNSSYWLKKDIKKFKPLLLHLIKAQNRFKDRFDSKRKDMSFLKRIGFSVSTDEQGVLTLHVPDTEALEYLWGRERELNPDLCNIPLETVPGTANDRVFSKKQIRARVISDGEERLHDLFLHYLPTADAAEEAAGKKEVDAFQTTSDHLDRVMQPWFDKIDQSRSILDEGDFKSDWLSNWGLKILDASIAFLIDSLTTESSFSSMQIEEQLIENRLGSVWLGDRGSGWRYFKERFGDTQDRRWPDQLVSIAIADMTRLLEKYGKACKALARMEAEEKASERVQ